ncbi:PYM1 [Auxenochlorella protothecoides x Auxenochlorella symbiontica]|uniref:WIBG Mago-binding domain-containing protein n=1 Tax=Auxenochlorella protothecoides TaxID=3075 RepID=A0A1D1ZXY2_AUXPR
MGDGGATVIPPSRRPDGTLRKEVRVRAGYVPQDEQPAYVPRQVQARQNVPKCPGLDETSQVAGAPKPKSKAATKNAKRKEKKVDGGKPAGVTEAPGKAAAKSEQGKTPAANPSDVAQQLAACTLEPGAQPDGPAPTSALRALKKKVRQAEELEKAQAAGSVLSPEQLQKLGHLEAWRKEVLDLEAAAH